MSLLAGACLAAASCSDSDEDTKLPSPNFPEAVSATIEAGGTYTLEIEPNQNWEVSVPTATAAWFWIQDETQKVWTLRGGAGASRIVIGVAELDEFDDTRVCEVTLKMGGQSKVIATITRGTLERGFSLRTCKIDEYGDFEYGDSETGLTYSYNEGEAQSIDLTWPEGRTDFSMPILVEANYEWAINRMPEWVSTPSVTVGQPGTKVEIRIQGNPSAYPLDGAQDKLVFIDRSNLDAKVEIPITIPSCRDIFDVTLDKELKFNAAAEIYNSMNGDWSPGAARGSVKSIRGARIYVIAEVTDRWGNTSLSGDEADTKWVTVTENAWDDDLVIMDRGFTIGTQVNQGDARTAQIIILPASLAVEDPNELFDYDIKEEFQPYVFATLTQLASPGPIQAANPDGMAEIGTMFEKLPSTHWSLRELEVDDAYKLTYTKAWSNDPEATLTFERDFTGYKCYDADCQPLSDEENWLSVRRVEGGAIIDMDREDGAPEDIEDGYQTSSLECDTLLSLKAGDYSLERYQAYDKNKILLETNKRPKNLDFTIEDNKTTEAKVGVTLYEADEYIRDYYALYEIWKALDGEHWSYRGENYPTGVNWDFNKDPDLWGVQPGVEVHSNGRVAKISIGEFGFRGHVPAAIGQLSELVELYLGTHNDGNLLEYDPSLAHDKSLSERNRTRMERHKEFLSLIHIPTQTSEPIARALAEHGISIPATSLYKNFTEDQIIDRKTGLQNNIRPYDVVHGKLTNGLKSIDPAIGKLEKLEYLNIANGELEEIPAEVANLKSLTDLEVYNCPKMTRFPVEIAQMPELVSVNISNNAQWSAEELYKGLDAIANGPSKEKLQILYATNNKLREIPESFSNLKKIGLLDLSRNQIETLHPLGKEVTPEQLYLDHNNITSLPANSDGIFCGTDDTETFSVTYNKLKKVPNIFSAKSKYVMKSVDFSYNEIDGFEGEEEGKYKGLRVETFSLAANPGLTKFPKCLGTTNSLVSYIILRGCSIDEIPEGSFGGKNSTALISLDLTYNKLKALSKDFTAEQLPYLYGLDISYNSFDKFPFGPLNCAGLTVYAIRGQRDAEGKRCLREWPTGLYQHTGLRGFYIGSNDLRKIEDTISYLIYHLDISDNPNITFDASAICYYWQQGVYNLIYDKTQNILNCDKMLE